MSGRKKGSASARNRMARLMAAQSIYQVLMSDRTADQVMKSVMAGELLIDPDEPVDLVDHDETLYLKIMRAWQNNADPVGEMLRNALEGKKGGDAEPLLKAILIAGIAEIYNNHDVDGPVIIKDYMTITESFYIDGEQKMVNAILDRVFKTVR